MSASTTPGRHWLDAPEWWKKWKPLRWLAALGVVAGIVSAFFGARALLAPAAHPETALYRQVQAGVPILDGFRSYASLADVSAALTGGGYRWTHTPLHKPPSPKYPPRDLDTLRVADYRHLGVAGDLRLEFFNDRLYEAHFAPRDAEQYRQRLHAAERRLRRDRNGKAELVAGNLRLTTNVDLVASDVGRAYGAEPYAIWQDLGLIAQRERWDAAYGVVALRP